jgi:hypothetical protein
MTATAPSVQTGSQAGLWQALASGLPPQNQAAINAQLALMAKKAANRQYIRDCIIKQATALTNGVKTQPFALSTPLTFNLPQPNNSYARGVIVHTELTYTIATTPMVLTAAGGLAIYDTIEVRYNKSQIKIRPYWLRQLAMIGAIPGWENMPALSDTGEGGLQNTTLQNYIGTAVPVAVGAQTMKSDIYIPFNILGADEDRGLLPSMPGETGVQVIVNTAVGFLGSDPIQNTMTAGGTLSAGPTGTVQVMMVYSDGECYYQPSALSYDMSVLDGTIQMQQDNPLTNLQAGSANINRGKLNILGRHQYVGLLVIDAVQSTSCATNANIVYLSSDKDDVGANSFWKYGVGTNMDVSEFFSRERTKHRQPAVTDLDEGVIFMIEAPIENQTNNGSLDGGNYLDNTTAGWPAWHYGISLTTLGALGSGPRIEPFTVYVNPVGLAPVGSPGA